MTVEEIHSVGAALEAAYHRLSHMLDGADPALAGAVDSVIAQARNAFLRLIAEHLDRLQELECVRSNARRQEELDKTLRLALRHYHALASLERPAPIN